MCRSIRSFGCNGIRLDFKMAHSRTSAKRLIAIQKAGAIYIREGGKMAGTVPTEVEKKCARCGDAFRCKQEAGCWCASVHVQRATLAEIRARFADCLCEDCLRKLAAGQKPAAAEADGTR